MINLRLASEYLASPVFCGDLEKMGHIEVDDLPVSRKLKIKIIEWDSEFQATFSDEYPLDSGFFSSDAQLRHIAAGQELAQELQQELGGRLYGQVFWLADAVSAKKMAQQLELWRRRTR